MGSNVLNLVFVVGSILGLPQVPLHTIDVYLNTELENLYVQDLDDNPSGCCISSTS